MSTFGVRTEKVKLCTFLLLENFLFVFRMVGIPGLSEWIKNRNSQAKFVHGTLSMRIKNVVGETAAYVLKYWKHKCKRSPRKVGIFLKKTHRVTFHKALNIVVATVFDQISPTRILQAFEKEFLMKLFWTVDAWTECLISVITWGRSASLKEGHLRVLTHRNSGI